MTSFGYGPTCKGWSEARKNRLCRALWDLLDEMTQEGKFEAVEHEGYRAYVEVDGLYHGVETRKITHLKPEVQDELVSRAEIIYRDIMAITPQSKK
jgi:hypothetical protein